MSTIVVQGIRVHETPIQVVQYGPAGRQTNLLNGASISSSSSSAAAQQDAGPVLSLYNQHGPNSEPFIHRCQHSLLLSSADTSRNPFFHQACVYLPQHEELYITSDLLQPSNSGSLPVILVSRVKLRRDGDGDGDGDAISSVTTVEWNKLRPPAPIAMPAGGTPYADGMVFCAQGSLATEASGGLYYMPRGRPPTPLVTGYYGTRFNSPYDVVVTRDGALWFTDPHHGFEKDFCKKPLLPCHVYRFHPDTGDLRVVADGLGRPSGIAFSPDESIVYITDTEACRVDRTQDMTRSATIYAFDVIIKANAPFLCNKRVFAFPIAGPPIGVKCDDQGFVYAGCADGIEVWNASGSLQAVVEIPGGVTNFCFGNCDKGSKDIFACANQTLWRLVLFDNRSEHPPAEQPSLMDQ